MAVQAIPVVGRGIAHEILVWVVAGYASQASVAFFTPALALFQAIRLRPDVGDPGKSTKLYVPPRPVASTAEIDGIHGVEFSRIENQVGLPSSLPRLPL